MLGKEIVQSHTEILPKCCFLTNRKSENDRHSKITETEANNSLTNRWFAKLSQRILLSMRLTRYYLDSITYSTSLK